MKFMSNWLGRLRQFINDTINELRKCSWPARNELFESTILVIVTVFILALFVSIVDILSREFITLISM